MPNELVERAMVVKEAQSWLGTPYRDNGGVKGSGVDCLMLLYMVYTNLSLIECLDPRPYPMQWAFHQRAERYLEGIQKFAREIDGPPLPGDIALFPVGLTYAHGTIVIDWPQIIHANPPGDCRYADAVHQWDYVRLTRNKPARFFTIWPRKY